MKFTAIAPLMILGTPSLAAEVEIIPVPTPVEVFPSLRSQPQLKPAPSRVEAIRPADGGARLLSSAPSEPAELPKPAPFEPDQSLSERSESAPPPPLTAGPPKKRPSSSSRRGLAAAKPPHADEARPSAPQQDRYQGIQDKIQAAIAAFEDRRYQESYLILSEVQEDIMSLGDAGLLALLGYAAMHAGDEATALQSFQQAAEMTGDASLYQAWADGLLHFKHLEEAEAVLHKMQPSAERDQRLAQLAMARANIAFEQGDLREAERLLHEHKPHLDAGGLELLGWVQYRSGKIEAAAEQFEAAYRKTPSKGAAQGLIFSLHRLNRHERLATILDSVRGPLDELIPPTTREALTQGQTRFDVDAEGRLTPRTAPSPGTTVRIEPTYRHKRGDAGEGRLSQTGMITTLELARESDTLKLQIDALRADNAQDAATGQRFYTLWQHRFEKGFESRLGVGRSLSGGAVGAAMLGEAGLGFYTADWGLGGRLFRRGNEESLLALSGMRDPLTGLTWGRILETGLSVDGYRRLGEWNALFSLTRSRLSGEGVADNAKSEFYARALRPIAAVPGLALGPELYASRFDKNLSAFEPGHGGYFSPESFLKLGALASYETRLDKFELQALIGIGWSWNQQEAADGTPLTGAAPGKYAASQNEGLTYHARLDVHWPLSSHWRLGFNLGGQKSADYTDWRAGIYAQYMLK